MDKYQIITISPQFHIQVLPQARGFSLSDHEKLLIENIWQHEENKHPQLHNGQIFNVISLEKERLIGEFIEYKYYLAQLRDPNFISALNIATLAISGVTTVVDKILIGRRADHVTTYANFYELVPSGGMNTRAQVNDRIDPIRQFEMELWEETAISVTEIKSIRPIALVFDLENRQYEHCAELSINYTILKEELQPSNEYQELKWISKKEVKEFIHKHEQEFVPFSLFLFHLASRNLQ